MAAGVGISVPKNEWGCVAGTVAEHDPEAIFEVNSRLPAVNPIEGPMVREMRGLRTGPAAEYSVDSDQLRDVCKLLGVFGRHGGIPRPIEVPCGDFLAFPQFEERLASAHYA